MTPARNRHFSSLHSNSTRARPARTRGRIAHRAHYVVSVAKDLVQNGPEKSVMVT